MTGNALGLKAQLASFGLTLHWDETRLIEFNRLGPLAAASRRAAARDPRFLGFIHYRRRTRDGRFIVKHKTEGRRVTRKLTALRKDAWLFIHASGHAAERFAAVLRGDYGYHGRSHNYPALNGFYWEVRRTSLRCLRRRSQKSRRMGWLDFETLTARFRLPAPRITRTWAQTRI
jgi:RNA-directed DNA polymerase